jgi:hypothetical protein
MAKWLILLLLKELTLKLTNGIRDYQMRKTDMTRFVLDLSRNLTEKRMPTELRGLPGLRLIIWEVDQDSGGRSVYDIYEGVGNFAVYMVNRNRKEWMTQGFQVDLEPAVYD